MENDEKPDWFDKGKLRKAYYDQGYTGWVVDMHDGTCRLANQPLLGADGPDWGDLVELIESEEDPQDGGLPRIGSVIEKHE